MNCICNDEHPPLTALWHNAYCRWFDHDRAGHKLRAALWGKAADAVARWA